MDPTVDRSQGIAAAITGSGGSGAVTAGQVLLAAIAEAELYGLMSRSAGPQIRGGESAAMVRFAPHPVDCMGDRYDALVCLDWNNIERFADELPLDGGSCIIADEQAGPPPDALTRSGARLIQLPLKALAKHEPQGRLNMVALGALGAHLGLPLDALEAGAGATIGGKGEQVLATSVNCIHSGYQAAMDRGIGIGAVTNKVSAPGARWNISGNEAAGLGALRGGVRFVAAYPITPASEMLEWLSPRLERLGGSLLQAEDELASVNMIIGASFGGVPALTATSGPGLALMVEGLGLAVASETPLVVANVQRGGPSTGIPTKSEQSDLNIALYGLHGDAPHLVLGALSIADSVFTFQWAMRLAEHMQTMAIVLTDQSLGQSRAITDPPTQFQDPLERRVEPAPGPDYRRYEITSDGISPMSLPGTPEGMYTADGLEHTPAGIPSSMAKDHAEQLAKRLRKVVAHDYGPHWAEVRGAGRVCLITWGSAAGAVFEAAERLSAEGLGTRAVALRLIAPLRAVELAATLADAEHILVVEQNQQGQLFRYLLAEQSLPATARSLARPGPLPLRPGEICQAVREQSQS